MADRPTPPTRRAPARPHVLADARRRARRRLVLAARPRRPRRCSRTSRPRTPTPTPMLAPHAALRDRIFDEIRGRVQETDESAPVPTARGSTSRAPSKASSTRSTAAGRAATAPTTATVLLDENALADGHDYFALGGFAVTPDHRVLAYSIDATGGERYTLRFRDLDDRRRPRRRRRRTSLRPRVGRRRAHVLLRPARRRDAPATGVAPHARHPAERRRARVPGGRRALLRRRRPHAQRSLRADRRRVEADVRGVVRPDRRARATRRASSRRASTGTSTPSSTTGATSTATASSIVTNAERRARNFELVAAPVRRSRARDTGPTLVPHRDDVQLDGVDAFADHLVLSERADGLERLRVMRVEDGDVARRSRCPTRVQRVGRRQPRVRHHDAALRLHVAGRAGRPTSTTTCDRATATVVKTQPVLGGYDPAQYTSARLWATAPDGTTRARSRSCTARDTPLDGTRAGAALRLRLVRALERPDVPRVAPVAARPRLRVRDRARARRRRAGPRVVRGRQARAQANTFTDFIACAEHLVAQRLHVARPARRARRERRRAADGRGREPAARPLRGDRRRGAVRRRRHDDARPVAAAHDHRVGGVGRPARARRVRAHEGVLAVRQRRAHGRIPRCS